MPTPYDDAVVAELAGIPPEKRAIPKIMQVQAGYTEEPGLHQCKDCWFFVEVTKGEGRCATVAGTIKAIGTCNHFKAGAYMEAGGAVENPTKVGQVEAGYMERQEGFACKTCSRFDAQNGACAVVYGQISPEGCCNYWSDGQPWVGG